MKYRPEIDGLRSVAVLPVILFHAGFSTFSGGYIGVDVFFVISGYLITTIILKDLEAGTFSFGAFYERRARRILPALFFVIICCIPFGWMWMTPVEFKEFSASVVAVSLFVSNILFWWQSGYFEAAAEFKPLLHTWSLAVEEQFYIFFPIAMLLIWRYGRRRIVPAIALVALASLALSEYGSRYFPSFNFFWLPTRAWELAAGSLCVFITVKPQALRDSVLSALGLAAIVFPVFSFDSNTPFPSLYALLPVIGTCAVIVFGQQGTVVGWLLSLKMFVGIGLISYSAYLWHQPLFAFARIHSMGVPTPRFMLSLVVLSLVLAVISWAVVERPFRRRGTWPLRSRAAVLGASVFAITGFSAAGLFGVFTNGFPERLPQSFALLDERLRFNRGLDWMCSGAPVTGSPCQTGENPEVLVWGDSQAMQLVEAVTASNPGVSVAQSTFAECPPVLGIAPVLRSRSVQWSDECMAHNDSVFNYLSNTKSVRYVLLGSAFGMMYPNSSFMGRDHIEKPSGVEIADAFRETLRKLKGLGITPIVVGPLLLPGFDAAQCNRARLLQNEDDEECSFDRTVSVQRRGILLDYFSQIATENMVIWLDDVICGGPRCYTSNGDVILYRDAYHLSYEGSAYIGKKLKLYDLMTSE